MTYYRIQQADRDTADLLDETNWQSANWGGGGRDCRGCADCDDLVVEKGGITCRGTGMVDRVKYGVSAVRDEDDLIAYAARAGMDLWSVPMVIVEMDGRESGDTPEDAEYGEVLILPSAITNTRPVTDEFIEAVFAALEDMEN